MYISLRNRSAYSFGSALTLPAELAERAADWGMPAMALTDLNGLYAAVPFQQVCEKAGVKPIFGVELSVTDRPDVGSTGGSALVTLLARGLAGYGNLCRLISLRQLGERPLELGVLCEHAGDLICLVGCTDVSFSGVACDTGDGRAHGRAPLRVAAKRGLGAGIDLSWHATGRNKRVSHTAGRNKRVSHATGRNNEESYGVGLNRRSAWGLSEWVDALREAFDGRLYVELSIHDPEDAAVARRRARAADRLGVPVVATCASRCLRRDQALTLKALSSIGTLTLLDQPHPDKPTGTWHLRTPEEMHPLFARRPDAIANTLVIAEQCNVTLGLSRSRFPPFASPDGRTAMQHLRDLAVAGCRRRYVEQPPLRGIGGKRPTLAEALERLERELSIIEQVHYAEYFLVFHEIAEHCRREGISFLARGSAADSLVCYVLGVSHACPFRFDLPFDRFINPERARFSKMADIDLDLPWDRRDQVIRWVYDRWGHNRVAMIGSPNTFHARAAVAELGKVYGLPAHEVYRTTKLLPHVTSWNLPAAIARSPEARGVLMEPVARDGNKGEDSVGQDRATFEEPYRTILRMARDLEGLPRHWSMHPCGLVVSPEPLTDLVPVQRSPKGPLVAQYDMDAIEDLGFVKIDLLGQAGLSVLRDATAEIARNCESRMANHEGGDPGPVARDGAKREEVARGKGKRAKPDGTKQPRRPHVDLERDVDYSDAETWDLIAGGHARGVHHIESPAMTSLLQQCNCRDIDCLTTVVAIIRPGAANQGKKDAFARRYQRREPPRYVHPSLKSILEKTYGLMVFEEHILQVAVEFAGMNLGRADVLRRALNKENRAVIAELKAEFCAGARRAGRTQREIAAVWSQLEGFCGFMFNKAHSAEYAVEAFQGAWLKRRWPAHYIAAILSNYRGFYAHSPTLPQILYVLEALRLGIGFLPPCVNRSRERFSVENREKNGEVRMANGERRNAPPTTCFTFRPSSFTTPPSPGRRWMIRVPVSHIKGLSQAFVERHLAERDKGPFASLNDFVRRCRPGEAEAQMLLDSGALDGFGESRPAMFWRLRRLLRRTPGDGATLWGLCQAEPAEPLPVGLTKPDRHQVARREMELLGFPITIDPLTHLGRDDKGRTIDGSRYVPVGALGRHLGRRVTVCGLMVADRINATTGGDLMKFVTLADRTGFVEAVLFPDVYRRFGHLTAANPILAAGGIVEPFENRNGFTLRVQHVSPPSRIACAAEPNLP